MNKHIIIGDVHGCYNELLDVYGHDRHPVFVGDLVDKGPRPHRCLELAKLLGATVVRGNHEENHLRYEKHEVKRRRKGKKNPMKRDQEFKDTHRKIMESSLDLIAWMTTFPVYHRIPKHNTLVIHGGLLPGVAPEDMQPDKICRVRNLHPDGTYAKLADVTADPTLPFWTELYTGTENVVYGHAPLTKPRIDTNVHEATCYGIDTACVYGGRLTGLLLPEFTFVSVKAEKVYYVQKWIGD